MFMAYVCMGVMCCLHTAEINHKLCIVVKAIPHFNCGSHKLNHIIKMSNFSNETCPPFFCYYFLTEKATNGFIPVQELTLWAGF